MNKNSSNPCIRCGKERIDSKTWKEKVKNFLGTSIVIHTQTVCPDPECQKIVDERLATQKQKSVDIQHAKEERVRQIQLARKRN